GHRAALKLKGGQEILVLGGWSASPRACLVERVGDLVAARINDLAGYPTFLLSDRIVNRLLRWGEPLLDIANVVQVHGELGFRVCPQWRGIARIVLVLVDHRIEHAALEVSLGDQGWVWLANSIVGYLATEHLLEDTRRTALGSLSGATVMVPVACVLGDGSGANPHPHRLRSEEGRHPIRVELPPDELLDGWPRCFVLAP